MPLASAADFKPMLAKDGDLAKCGFPQIAQPKYDGIRAAVVDGKLVSRTLKPIQNAEIRAALERPDFEGFDGELIVGDPTTPGCMQRTSSFVMAPNKTGEPWAFYAFDLWNEPGPYSIRADRLRTRVERTTWESVPVCAVEGMPVHNAAELDTLEAKWLAEGHEGVILRDPAGLYKFGRSGKRGPLLKVKRFSDSEAVILGTAEEMHNGNERVVNELGRGQRSTRKDGLVGKGTLGKLLVRDRYSGVEFSIGTGFSAAQRQALWQGREALVGQHVTYKFFPVGVKDAPRHPVFVSFRAEDDLPETS